MSFNKDSEPGQLWNMFGAGPEETLTTKSEQKKISPEERRKQEALQAIKKAKRLFVPFRNRVYPRWNSICTLPDENLQIMRLTAAELFPLLGFSDEQLREVYEYVEYNDGSRDNPQTKTDFTGNFTQGGRQKLADLLGKPIEFYWQPGWEPVINRASQEVYYPTQSEET